MLIYMYVLLLGVLRKRIRAFYSTLTCFSAYVHRPIIIDAKIPEVISAEFLLATIVHNADDDYSDVGNKVNTKV